MSFANEPSGPGAAGSVGQVTWRVESDKLLIQIKSGLNQSVRIDSMSGSIERVLASNDETITVTAYTGTATYVFLDSKVVANIFVADYEGVKFPSIKPVFSAVWTANKLNLSVRNLKNEQVSFVRVQVGSKVEELPVVSDQVMNTYELSSFQPIKIWLNGRISFRQSATDKFKNCKQLSGTFSGGIAKALASATSSKSKKIQPTFSKSLYTANKSLDRDKDGIACEK